MEEVFCPDCGKEVGESVRFRLDCGQRPKMGSVRPKLDMGNLGQGLAGAARVHSHLRITLASPGRYVQQEVKSCQGS